jgi:enoyl-[acyl-carrier protein] reductase I
LTYRWTPPSPCTGTPAPGNTVASVSSGVCPGGTTALSLQTTTAGSGVKGFDGFISFAEEMSPLGNADALACADYCISLFSDLTRYVTMQNLFHDGGFSSTGVTPPVIERFSK